MLRFISSTRLIVHPEGWVSFGQIWLGPAKGLTLIVVLTTGWLLLNPPSIKYWPLYWGEYEYAYSRVAQYQFFFSNSISIILFPFLSIPISMSINIKRAYQYQCVINYWKVPLSISISMSINWLPYQYQYQYFNSYQNLLKSVHVWNLCIIKRGSTAKTVRQR